MGTSENVRVPHCWALDSKTPAEYQGFVSNIGTETHSMFGGAVYAATQYGDHTEACFIIAR